MAGFNRRMPYLRARQGGRAGGGAAAFDPSQLAGLEAWFRGDNITYGATVTFTDLSGNGRDLTQSTAAAKPTSSSRLGQSAASFDGSDYVQGTGWTEIAQPYTVFAVFEVSGISTDGLWDGVDATHRSEFWWQTSTLKWYLGSGTGTTSAVSAGELGICAVANGASSDVYEHDFSTDILSANPGAHALNGLTIGANITPTPTLNGWFSELFIVSGAATQATRNQVRDYFNDRYTFATALT